MSFADHLPLLVLLVPLLGGVLSVFTGGGRVPWLWACSVTLLTFLGALELLSIVTTAGTRTYALGDWPAPWGIELVVDTLSAIVITLVSGIATVVTFFARRNVEKDIPADRLNFFYSLWLLAITGLLGITATGDAFNLYVLLEISSLTIYALVAMGKETDRRALPAAINYLVMGSIGASFLLIGVGYLYMATGTLNMADLHETLTLMREAEGGFNRTVLTSFAFITVGLGLKMALFPLHTWMPNAYTYAPAAVSALLAATATKVGIYMAFRFTFTVFGSDFGFLQPPNSTVLMACACGAVLFGSYVAIRQRSLARLLAYSSVAQIGYIVLGLSVLQTDAVTGSILHIVNHALMKGGLFLVVGVVAWRLGSSDLSALGGLGRRMPLTSAAFVVGGLGLIGVPGTAGFVSKWYLLSGLLSSGHWPLAVTVLIGSVLAGIYVWRVVEFIYFRPLDPRHAEVSEGPVTMLLPVWILIGLSLWFGVHSAGPVALAGEAARTLLGQGG
ncbi:MAG: monovalent cation/H+ antiporter subunit D family protein [Planctomycetota bacterium]